MTLDREFFFVSKVSISCLCLESNPSGNVGNEAFYHWTANAYERNGESCGYTYWSLTHNHTETSRYWCVSERYIGTRMVLIIVKLKTSSISLLSEHVVVLVGGSCKKTAFRTTNAIRGCGTGTHLGPLALESIPRPSKTTFRWDCL